MSYLGQKVTLKFQKHLPLVVDLLLMAVSQIYASLIHDQIIETLSPIQFFHFAKLLGHPLQIRVNYKIFTVLNRHAMWRLGRINFMNVLKAYDVPLKKWVALYLLFPINLLV